MHVLLLLFLSSFLWANPFAPYLMSVPASVEYVYPQVPPYTYPFFVTKDLENKKLNPQSVVEAFSTNALDEMEKIYYSIPFNEKISLYNYPFPIKSDWEFLPYSFVGDIGQTSPESWINSFKTYPENNEGVGSVEFQNQLNELTSTKAYSGNIVKMFKTPLSFPEILRRVKNSKDHILFSTFLFQCDAGTKSLVEQLEFKIKEGISVYILYDKLFKMTNPACLKKLKSIGAEVKLIGGLKKIFHEKMYVFDGENAMIDGQNMLAAQALSTGTNDLYVDTAVGVEGPMVTVIAQRFIEHWDNTKGLGLPERLKALYQNKLKEIEKYSTEESIKDGILKREGVCRLVAKDPGKNDLSIFNLYMNTVKHTKNYLFFNFIDPIYKNPQGKTPQERFLTHLFEIMNSKPALRVDMLTNNWKLPTDIDMPKNEYARKTLFSRAIVLMASTVAGRPNRNFPQIRKNISDRLTNPNFHWWSHAQFVHAKTLMSDNIWTLIGSYNINKASQNYSYEQVLACLDTNLAKQMQESIVIDALNSIPIPLVSAP